MNDEPSLPACGVLGLGAIGAAMARRLAATGHRVTGHDIDLARVRALAPAGVRAAASARELGAASDVVVVALPDTPQILACLAGDAGLEAGLRRGAALVISSTVDPATPQALAERLAAEGVDVLDAPISGGPVAAEAGTLAMMVGASPEVYARHAALLGALASHPVHVGPVGHGEVAKLVNNLMGSVIAVGVAEGLALAAASGADVERVIEAVASGSGGSRLLSEWFPRTVLADRSITHFAIDLMCKDMSLVGRLAADSGVRLAAGAVAAETFAELRDAGYGRSDFSILAAVRAEEAGAELPEARRDPGVS